MPPKAKFTREQITNTALEIVRSEGIDSLTARTLAKRLGSSSCPIFTVFKNMEEVQYAVTDIAKSYYKDYIAKGLADAKPFKGVGMQYILFSIKEPKLFQLLFMNEQTFLPNINNVLPLIDESYEKILSSIIESYGVNEQTAKKLYRHLWIYSHGIATLCATKMCHFTGKEIGQMISEVFASLIKNVKEVENND